MQGRKSWKTESGIDIKPLYTEEDIKDRNLTEKLGLPGEYPFTRGIYPLMYRQRLWTMRQYSGFGSAEETNRRFRFLLSQGQTGLSVAFDLPTQMGYDSDHPRVAGEVGKVGVAISTIDDMSRLMDGIPLDKVSTSMTINSTAAILLSFYIAEAARHGIKPEQLRGTVQNDILKEFIARNTFIYPPEPSLRLAVDIIEYTSRNVPKFHPISISGYHIREAGATAVQELAFTFYNACVYVERALERGLDIDAFAPTLSFFFVAGMDFFEEIAKFRAARRIWATIMREWYGAKKRESMMLKFHTQTSGASLTAIEPMNNITRVTLQALSAILGGTQSLHTNAYDEALAIPTELSAKLALRIQQIIAYETNIPATVDPLAGSYYVEALTDEVENRAWKLLEELRKLPLEQAITRMINEISDSAYLFQREVEEGERIIIGVNMFKSEEIPRIDLMKVDPELEKIQVERLKQFRNSRDLSEVKKSLTRLKESAESEDNLVPPILECVKARATLGEISDTLRQVFGTYQKSTELGLRA
ncbi:MAG: methylmalonyl-CoA mutase family protein [Aigarchaeota archaeon]|nr:methylmalonyl-CoA mutase family protein [Candidatus Pelearchaeum maunauluense]